MKISRDNRIEHFQYGQSIKFSRPVFGTFVLIGPETLRVLGHHKGLVVLPSKQMYRQIMFPVPSRHAYHNLAVLMKESPAAQIVQFWYRHAQKVIRWVFEAEKPRLEAFGVREGDVLPWWSITGWLAGTLFYID